MQSIGQISTNNVQVANSFTVTFLYHLLLYVRTSPHLTYTSVQKTKSKTCLIVTICFLHFRCPQTVKSLIHMSCIQCDQIGQFIGLWATFQSLCPNLPHSQAIFAKESKTIIFLVKSFLGNFWKFFLVTLGYWFLPDQQCDQIGQFIGLWATF